MSEPFLAEVRMVGFNFAPRGWAFCDGQILPINQNQSLFSLLGTIYGGDGRTTFALPEMRGRIPFHEGNGMNQGQRSGEEAHTLTSPEIANHSHTMKNSNKVGNSATPINNIPAQSPNSDRQFGTTSPNANMQSSSFQGGAPHNNMPPFQAVHFCIAIVGLFPSRS